MAISDADLDHLATLARLQLPDAERAALRADLNAVLGYFELLSELPTEGVEPLVRPLAGDNVLREDAARPSLPPEVSAELLVARRDGFAQVPRTVDEA